MPIYVYEVVLEGEEDEPGQVFEVMQKMTDPPLTEHPTTGQPVRRVIMVPNLGGKWTDSSMNHRMKDDKKLDQLGFTKYVKQGDGYYEKRAGKGPDTLHRD